MKATRTRAVCIFFLAVALVGPAFAEDRPAWARPVDVDSLDVEETRKNNSLWSLLAECVAKGSSSKSKVQAEAYYINPVTYIPLRASLTPAVKNAEEMKAELKEVYGRYAVFYVLLKTPDDERLISPDEWKVSLRTASKKEYAADRMEITPSELVFGYTGTYYQTKLLLFFDTSNGGAAQTVDVLAGDYLHLANRVHRLADEIRWVSSPTAGRAANPVAKVAFKIVVAVLFGLLVVLCILTRPRKEWSRKQA